MNCLSLPKCNYSHSPIGSKTHPISETSFHAPTHAPARESEKEIKKKGGNTTAFALKSEPDISSTVRTSERPKEYTGFNWSGRFLSPKSMCRDEKPREVRAVAAKTLKKRVNHLNAGRRGWCKDSLAAIVDESVGVVLRPSTFPVGVWNSEKEV